MDRLVWKRRIVWTGIYALLIVAAFVSIFPFYWMIAGATNTSNAVAEGSIAMGSHFMENFRTLNAAYEVETVLWNSFKIAIISVVLNLLITSLAAFGFEKMKTKASEKVYTLLLVSMMIPFSALVIPLYRMMAELKLVNTHTAVIIPTMANIFLIFFFRQNFKAFPNAILESAKIDGASTLRTFFTIVVPSMKSTYAAATIYAFMSSWNSFMWPLIVLQTNDKATMPLLISTITTASYIADYGMQMMALVITTIPMIIIFFSMQRQFVEGLVGTIKG